MSSLIIQTPDNFRFRSTLLSHGWLQLAPFSHDGGSRVLTRIQRLATTGRVVELSIAASDEEALAVHALGTEFWKAEEPEVRELVGRMFGLDRNLRDFYERIDGIPRYAWVIEHGAGRLLRAPTVWEDLAKTLLTTNTTWSMTRSMVSRLVALGEPLHGDEAGDGARSDGRCAFPEPERIAEMPLDEFSMHVRTGYRSAYLHPLARSIAGGTLDVESWADPGMSASQLYASLRGLKGFGPYAAGSMLRMLGHYGELAIDSAARTMFKQYMKGVDGRVDAAIREHYAPYSEWKGLVFSMDLMRYWFLEQIQDESE